MDAQKYTSFGLVGGGIAVVLLAALAVVSATSPSSEKNSPLPGEWISHKGGTHKYRKKMNLSRRFRCI